MAFNATSVVADTIELPDLHLHFHFDNSCNNCCRGCDCSGWTFISCVGGGRKGGESFQINNGDVVRRTTTNVYRQLVSHAEDVCEDNGIDPEHGQLFVIFCFYLRNIPIGERGEEILSKGEIRSIQRSMERERLHWGLYDDFLQRLKRVKERHLRQIKTGSTPGMRKYLNKDERQIIRAVMKKEGGEAAIRRLHRAGSVRELLLPYKGAEEGETMTAVQVLAQIIDRTKDKYFSAVKIN